MRALSRMQKPRTAKKGKRRKRLVRHPKDEFLKDYVYKSWCVCFRPYPFPYAGIFYFSMVKPSLPPLLGVLQNESRIMQTKLERHPYKAGNRAFIFDFKMI
jgi:hypothetical protein